MTTDQTTASDTSEKRIVVGVDGSPRATRTLEPPTTDGVTRRAIDMLRRVVALDATALELDP